MPRDKVQFAHASVKFLDEQTTRQHSIKKQQGAHWISSYDNAEGAPLKWKRGMQIISELGTVECSVFEIFEKFEFPTVAMGSK